MSVLSFPDVLRINAVDAAMNSTIHNINVLYQTAEHAPSQKARDRNAQQLVTLAVLALAARDLVGKLPPLHRAVVRARRPA